MKDVIMTYKPISSFLYLVSKTHHLLYKDKRFHLKSEASLSPKMNTKTHHLLSIISILIYSHNVNFQETKAHTGENKNESLCR